ncbi:MAG TPA: NADH-quinone oxidoreductase subunit L [Verrucomicrobiae bacterium]|jgi:NADH-quinone oxidoreductase subunit L|nr:NADH-quinone oxidoreductase subunit L [Verrucomicrobiae bacterium]
MSMHLWIIPLLPLAGAAINGLLGKRFPKALVNTIALGSTGAAFAYALWVAAQFLALPADQIPYLETYGTWMSTGNFSVHWGFWLDQLSFVMLLVVTGVGFVIHIFSVGYMAEEGGYYRYFSYLNLFMFFMLMLILADNYLQMFVGWEGVGLVSYLLVGFWFTKVSAANAGKKAFITNRVGDFGFLIALFLLIKHFSTLEYAGVFKAVAPFAPEASAGLLTAIALLMLVGATGKSAQIPLYVWLPDAMEGPTPVSALIHAATMVTAGVYMVARSNPIFSRAPVALEAVAVIGTLTAIFAASIGLVQNDIKKVLAYSTISQLGYMFMGCGVLAYSAGIFHLMTHAFFKGCLFLCSGSIIHGLSGEQDMRFMGGLRKYMPWTFWCMTSATIAIAGLPPFAAFFSKDAILWSTWSSGQHLLWLIGIIAAGMTSFYMFRLWFLTFWGEYRGPNPAGGGHGHDADAHQAQDAHATSGAHGHGTPHESPWVMVLPLVILAILSFVGGWIGVPESMHGPDTFNRFLAPVFTTYAPAGIAHAVMSEGAGGIAAESSSELAFSLISVGVAAFGLFLAWYFYYKRKDLPAKLAASAGGLYRLVLDKYRIDELYGAVIIQPLIKFSSVVLWQGIDVKLIDAGVDNAAHGAEEVSDGMRHMQSGNIRSYAGWVAVGATVIIAFMVWRGLR